MLYNRWNKLIWLCCRCFVPAVRSQHICIFGTESKLGLEVRRREVCSDVKCLLTPVKKKISPSLPTYSNEKQGLPQTHKGPVGLLSEDFVCAEPASAQTAAILLLECWNILSKQPAGLTTPVAALGFGVVLEKWLFFCSASFLCSQTITVKVETAQHYTQSM